LAREVGGMAGTIEGAVEFGPDAVFVSLATGLHAGALHRCLDAGLPIFCEKPIALTLLASSGGTYRDLHIHDFDLARWLTGMEIEQVYAVGSVRGFDRYVKYGDVDNVAILMTKSDGLPVLITGTRHNPRGHDFRMEVFGSEDSLSVGSDSLSQPRLVEPDAVLLSKDPYRDFIERFGEGLRQ
jgi:myo-inositol 2-dehydrogenase / D-chiro-inositol 1-dehydrogenase